MAATLIIGGTAAYHLAFDQYVDVTGEHMVATPFGEAGPVLRFRYAGQDCAFLSRHGGEGRLGVTPPYINYRANVWAAREVGADRILSWNSAGALVRSLEPGSVAAVADIIDWTRARPQTFGEHLAERHHVTGPLFDAGLRQALVRAARDAGCRVAPGAVYVGTEGARLETAAEISLLAAAGAEIVGMTMAPEVFLARELGLRYGSLCWISNYATGIAYDGPEQRLFGPEVGPLMLGIMLRLLKEEGDRG
ncbi:MAG TPA: MTAP family purine nucleoside phosphorylase [Symbiobacteriaceae bacterium]|nr:MTAP family purine nucleoside phosphorylase [Symbiobacteriaceae bacterium]